MKKIHRLQESFYFSKIPAFHIVADDLGYSSERDAGILFCAAAGAITRASLLVNGATAASALEQAVALGLPVGLHLNLTEGRPVHPDVPSLLAPGSAVMRSKHQFRTALAAGEVSSADVVKEALAQWALFAALHPNKEPPMAFDGHQHVHVLPGVAEALAGALAGLAAATRIPAWAGEAVEPLLHLDPERAAFYAAVSQQAQAARAVYAAAGIAPLGAVFVGFGLCGRDCTLERVQAAVAAATAAAAGGAVEVMCHPGFRTLPPGEGLSGTEGQQQEQEQEQEALVDGGGAPFKLRQERAQAWASSRLSGSGAGCAGCPADSFACSWEREREMAVLLALRREGINHRN